MYGHWNINIGQIGIYLVPLMLGVILHEVAHGWVAEKLGDPTARLMGRISLNPLVHIDILGTVLLPLILFLTNAPFLFGWAKPVPVRGELLRGGRVGMAKVAMAGPLTNLAIAVGSSFLYHGILWIYDSSTFSIAWLVKPVLMMSSVSVAVNLALMIINLVPIPPLDGGRIIMGIVPESLALTIARMERYGMIIIVLLIVTDVWSLLLGPLLRMMVNFFLWK